MIQEFDPTFLQERSWGKGFDYSPRGKNQARLDQAAMVLQGGIHVHVHAFPDISARKVNCLKLVEKGQRKGMVGILMKDLPPRPLT